MREKSSASAAMPQNSTPCVRGWATPSGSQEVLRDGRTYLNADRLYTLRQAVTRMPATATSVAEEVDAFKGGSAKLIAEAMRASDRGLRFYVCDTFTGHAVVDPAIDGRHHVGKSGSVRTPSVARYLRKYSSIQIVEGDIRGTVAQFEDQRAFGLVHIDVDVHPVTQFCLEFFAPGVVLGATIVVDDYGFTTCRGSRRRWTSSSAASGRFGAMHLLTAQAVLSGSPEEVILEEDITLPVDRLLRCVAQPNHKTRRNCLAQHGTPQAMMQRRSRHERADDRLEESMRHRCCQYFLVFASFLILAPVAGAAPILTLFDTGVDAAGNLLIGPDGTTDPHWDVIAGPGLGGVVDAETYKHPAYAADGPDSRWISVNEFGSTAGSGTYTFQTTFDLTGFDPAATSITMSCATDNLLTSWLLNGVAQAGDCDGFHAFPIGSATVNSGFLAGINTLQFLVQDLGQPMAFRAEFDSTTRSLEPGTAPEPASALLLMTGLAAARWARRRTRSS